MTAESSLQLDAGLTLCETDWAPNELLALEAIFSYISSNRHPLLREEDDNEDDYYTVADEILEAFENDPG
ncbi:4915_t:CDS:2 [Paraglomus brasilianum]|uniref:4915_t:CDS:1 n=1 Tax=Paraglomus brasilianum TaxID=144538 RepID=A0A9N9A2K8_9GLOM|nr:4915_t:CDS:2 [Paraglomus brasilianum]